MSSNDVTACAEIVERGDPSRFRAIMAAPADARPNLFVFYAFNIEVARAPWASQEAMISDMRLQWWYDVLEAIETGSDVARHPVATPLAEILSTQDAGDLKGLVEARRWDIYRDPFEDQAALEEYIHQTSAVLIRISAHSLGEGEPQALENYGWAVGCANYLSAIPALLSQKRVPLVDGRPEAVKALAQTGLDKLKRARASARTISKPTRAALLVGWEAEAKLAQAKAHPERVIDGLEQLNPIRSSLRLLWQASTGRF